MNPNLRTILAIVLGIIVGMFANMGTLQLGIALFGSPAGVDLNDINSINEHIQEYSFVQLMVPFLAHAIGTLVAAFIVTKLAASKQMALAIGIGVFFLLFGIYGVTLISNAPLWFNVLDLLVAYVPMGWLGGKLAGR